MKCFNSCAKVSYLARNLPVLIAYLQTRIPLLFLSFHSFLYLCVIFIFLIFVFVLIFIFVCYFYFSSMSSQSKYKYFGRKTASKTYLQSHDTRYNPQHSTHLIYTGQCLFASTHFYKMYTL